MMLMDEKDRTSKLIRAARGGDRAAFDRLADLFKTRLEGLIHTRLGARLREKIELEDVLQETFLRAFSSIERFQDGGADSFFRWLGGIASHVIQESARRNKQEVILSLEDDIPSRTASPSKAGERQERFERLQAALDRLSPEHRQVILLARVKRLPLKEVANRLDRSPEAVSQLLWRALAKLKEAFGSTDSIPVFRKISRPLF